VRREHYLQIAHLLAERFRYLTRLSLSFWSMCRDDEALKLSYPQPLQSCSRITVLQVHPTGSFSVDHDDVDRLAKSWPSRRSLTLGGTCPWPPPGPSNTSTWRTLSSLHDHCPHLEYLELRTFDSSPPIPVPRTGSHPSRPLRLKICQPPKIDNPIAVAVFLSMLWPKLQLETAAVSDAWNKVIAAVTFHSQRQQVLDYLNSSPGEKEGGLDEIVTQLRDAGKV